MSFIFLITKFTCSSAKTPALNLFISEFALPFALLFEKNPLVVSASFCCSNISIDLNN